MKIKSVAVTIIQFVTVLFLVTFGITLLVRLLPGVMGHAESGSSESFEQGLLEYPQYTRPREFEGEEIPAVLLSGDHQAIARWKQAQSERITAERRPDLLAKGAKKP